MESMKPSFNFKVVGEAFLSPAILQSLTLLYQPIIGPAAYSLYHIFLSLPSGTTQKHHLLLQIIGNNMEALIKTRHRLEAIGLLDVYEADEDVTYVLKPPLTAKQFFGDAIMRAFLYVKLGAQDFNVLKNLLLIPDNPNTANKATKRFDEIFDVRALTGMQQNIPADLGHVNASQGVKISTIFEPATLSAILLKKGISQEIISSELLKILNELAFLYKFDVHELARLVFDCLTPDGAVDLVQMKTLARSQFQLISKGANVQVVVKDEAPKSPAPVASKSKQGIIAFLEQSPVDFLQFKSGGIPPVPADVKLVEWLYVDQEMPAGVVNVLVDYVLNTAEGTMPKQLIEKVAGQWQRQGVKTTAAAMDKVEKFLIKQNNYKKEKQQPIASKNRNFKNATRVEPIPEWLKNANNHENPATDEAAKKRIEQMKLEMLNGGLNNEAT